MRFDEITGCPGADRVDKRTDRLPVAMNTAEKNRTWGGGGEIEEEEEEGKKKHTDAGANDFFYRTNYSYRRTAYVRVRCKLVVNDAPDLLRRVLSSYVHNITDYRARLTRPDQGTPKY